MTVANNFGNDAIVGFDGAVAVAENNAANPEMIEAEAGAVGPINEIIEVLDESVAEFENDAANVNDVATIEELFEEIAIVGGADAFNEIPIANADFGSANIKGEVVISHAALDEMNDILLHAYDGEFNENVFAPDESIQAHLPNATIPPTANDEIDIDSRCENYQMSTNIQHVNLSECASSTIGPTLNDLHENEHFDVFFMIATRRKSLMMKQIQMWMRMMVKLRRLLRTFLHRQIRLFVQHTGCN